MLLENSSERGLVSNLRKGGKPLANWPLPRCSVTSRQMVVKGRRHSQKKLVQVAPLRTPSTYPQSPAWVLCRLHWSSFLRKWFVCFLKYCVMYTLPCLLCAPLHIRHVLPGNADKKDSAAASSPTAVAETGAQWRKSPLPCANAVPVHLEVLTEIAN